MNNKEKVLKIYPYYRCIKRVGGYIISDSWWNNVGHFEKTEEVAWQQLWKQIELLTLAKLCEMV